MLSHNSNQKDPVEERLRELDSQLRKKKAAGAENKKPSSDNVNFGNAIRLSTEFVVAILVGAGIGWTADEFFGTRPWAMIVFLPLGFIAGVRNVMRAAGLLNNPACKNSGENINRE